MAFCSVGDLAVLTRALQLLLHLGNLRLERRDLLRELVDGRGQVRDLRVEPVDVTRLQLLRTCKTTLKSRPVLSHSGEAHAIISTATV